VAVVKGCDHIGIQVRDVELSARFYEETLGFQRVERWTLSHPYVQRVVGHYPDVTLEIALLAIPDSDLFLEVLEYRGVDGAAIDPDTANPGTAHLCLFVDDLDELHRELTAKGVEFVSEVQTPTWGPNEGGRLVYMKDPDGIRVELVETRRRSDGAPI
jgi:catechol 2,3-dioxygenase-like lactoylglutathione lyase family enzyme